MEQKTNCLKDIFEWNHTGFILKFILAENCRFPILLNKHNKNHSSYDSIARI